MRKVIVLVAVFLACISSVDAQNGANDASFNVYDNPSSTNGGVRGGSIMDMLILPNGKIIIVGSFNMYNNVPLPGIARLNADGSLDQTFNTGASIGGDSIIIKVKLMADGRLLILGKFTCMQGSTVLNNLARLNSNGSPDISFNHTLTGNSSISDVVIQSNGDLLVAERFKIYKLNNNGTLIQSIFPEPNTVYAYDAYDGLNQLVENADGTVYVVGNHSDLSQNFRKIFPDGTLISIPGVDAYKIWKAVLQPDGKFLLFGEIRLPGDPIAYRRDAIRLHADGSVDNSFQFTFTGNMPNTVLPKSLTDVAIMPDGRMLLSYTDYVFSDERPFFYDGCVSNCICTNCFYFDPQCVPAPCPCSETLFKRIYQINQNGSTVTSDTLGRIVFKYGVLNRIFLQNNSQLLVAGDFGYGTCPNSPTVPKMGFCRINLINDEPCQAREVIPAAAGVVECTSTVSGNLTGASVNGYASCSVNKDLWYSFTATNITHQIRVTGNGDIKPTVTLYNTGVCSSLSTNFLLCASSNDPGGTVTLTKRDLIIGGVYYLKISYAGTAVPVNQTFGVCVLTPLNDEPCTAIEITPAAPGVSACTNPVTGDVQVASFNNQVTCTPNNPDVWYTFTATSASHVIMVTGNNLFAPAFAVFTASACADVANPALLCVPGPTSGSEVTVGGMSGLTIGATYYIKVSNASAGINPPTTFSICVLTPVHDEPCTAGDLPIPVLPGETTCSNSVSGNMLLATGNDLSVSCSNSSVPQPDLWYRFVAAHSSYILRTAGADINFISLFSSNSCNDLNAAIIPCRSFGLSIIPLKNLTIGATYYIRINGSVDANFSGFSICLLLPPGNNEPCGALNLISSQPGSSICSQELVGDASLAANNGAGCTQSALWYKFTATQTSHFLKMNGVEKLAFFSAASCSGTMTELGCYPASCFDLDNMNFFPMKNLIIGNTYYLAIQGSSGLFNICLLSADNDEACGAKMLGNCTAITEDLLLATASTNISCDLQTPYVSAGCLGFSLTSIQPKDLWYTFTATQNFASLVFNRTGTGFLGNLQLRVRVVPVSANCLNPSTDGICGAPVTLGSSSPYIRTFATVTDQEYYVVLSNAEYAIPAGGGGFSMELRMGASSVSVTQDPPGPVCLGTPVSFTATTTNPGTSPQLNWFVNNIPSGTGTAFSSATLQNNDVVKFEMTSSNCVSPPTVSQSITMDIYPIPTWYADGDGDGFGNAALASITTCVQPAGYVNNNTDCDDADPSVFPGSIVKRPFRTRQNGSWGSTQTWESFDGCNWITGGIPSASDSTISINHEVTITGGATFNANELIVENGRLNIYGTLNLADAPGEDLLVGTGGFLYMDEGSLLSGTGTALVTSDIFVYAAARIAVQVTNQGVFNFTRYYGGCCLNGLLQLSNGSNTGTILNDGTMIISAGGGGIREMTISGGKFHNRSGGQVQSTFDKVVFNVNEFINDGLIIAGSGDNNEGSCSISSTLSATHNGRFSSTNINKVINISTGGTFTYTASSIFDGYVHFTGGTHDINGQYNPLKTYISAHVNFLQPEVNFNGEVLQDAGLFSGPAIKKINTAYFWWAGTLSGGDMQIATNATGHLGAGSTSLGTLAGRLINNGIIYLVTGYGGCCFATELNMANGIIENNGQFIFPQTGGGGIYFETLSGGTFNNNSSGTIINNLMGNPGDGTGYNEIYLRNTVFTNNGTILANGKSINIFPTTNPVINGTITVPAGGQVKFGIASTTTTISSNAILNGTGTINFFEGNHEVNTASYDVGVTSIGQTYSGANVYFNAANVAFNYVHMNSGILGGAATKLIKDDMVYIIGQITGGPISNTDTSVFHYGAGNPNLGAINTAFTNNGTVSVSAYYVGCCTGPTIDLTGGSITNNGTFNVTGSGGIYYVAMYNGSFINTETGVINSNMPPSAQPFRMQPASFINSGTINLLTGVMELGSYTLGGIINTSDNTHLSSTGPITFNGTLINNNGNITIPFNFITTTAKTLKGNGTFSSNVALNDAATVTPGSSPGILTVAGNYTQGAAALTIEIGGITPGTGYDRLAVTGTATISGTLNATELAGFDAQGVTTLDIITASSVTGTFSQVNLPPLWSVHYAANKVSLIKFFQFVYCRDADSDGFGNPADTIRRTATTAPAGYTADSTDCNDANAAVNPSAIEICDGIDNDCDGIVDSVYMPGLIVYMPLNGHANDLSGNGLNGTINGSVTAVADRFGNPNAAMSFPGSISSHIRINDNPLLRPSSITLSAWVNMSSQPGHGSFITKSINCFNDSWHFGSQGGNYSTWVSNTTNCGDFVQMVSPNSTNVWRHIVFTLDETADIRKMYVDGNLVATGSYTSSIPYDGNPVLIGTAIENGNLDFPFHGILDEVIIFNRAITATEVNALFANAVPVAALNSRYYADADGDGFGNPAISQLACTQPSGFVLNNTDCNDNSAAAYPGATEICDGIDNDCDGQIDVVILTTGLVAYYPFSGHANDAVGSLNGTVNGATLTTDRFGNASSAYSFDGVNDFINTSNVALTQTDNWTMTAWVKPAAISPDVIVVQNGGDGGGAPCNGYSMGLNNLNVTGYHPCVAFLNGGSAVSQVDQWIHLTMVRQSGVTRFYLNGVQTPNTFTSQPITPAGVITIGSASGIRFFNGSIDDVKIFNIALTPAQILQDINAVPVQVVYYQDTDGDGFGNPLVTTPGTCGAPAPTGYVSNNTDCDDTNVNLYPNVTPGVINGINPILVTETSVFTTNGASGGTWSSLDPLIASVDPVSGLITGVNPGNTTISYTIATCTGTANATFSLTVNSNINPGIVSGPPSLCIGATALFTSSGTPGGTWSSSIPGRATVDPATGLVTGIAGGLVNIIYTVGGSQSASASLTVIASPSQNLILSDLGLVFCIGQTRTFHLLFSDNGIWSSSNTSVATVHPNSGFVTAIGGGIADIIFTKTNQCGQSLSTSKQIRVIPASGSPVVTGPVNVCAFVGTSTPVKYVATLPGIRIFNWTVPPNVTIVSGQSTDTLTVTFAAGFTTQANKQIVCAPAIDRVCTGVSLTSKTYFLQSQLPGTPAPITASTSDLCPSFVTNILVYYSIPKVPGAASYRWSLSVELSIAMNGNIIHPNGFGENDTIIGLSYSQVPGIPPNSFINVRASNDCGVSDSRRFNITYVSPSTPSLISGPTNICEHLAPGGVAATYSVPQQPTITNYTWTVPAGVIGLTGQGTNTISFIYPVGFSTGSISVVASNGCGTSAPRSKSVTRLSPGTPSVIDVINTSICPNREFTYSLASMPSNSTSVLWTAPGTIISGQGTASIRVVYPSTAVNGSVKATAISNCGNSGTRSVTVKLPSCPVDFTSTSGNVFSKGFTTEVKPADQLTIDVFPNPSVSDFHIRISSTDKNTPANIRILDMLGRELSRMQMMPDELQTVGSKLRPGIYLIDMVQGSKRIVKKLIKR